MSGDFLFQKESPVDESQVIDWMISPPSSKLFRKIHPSHGTSRKRQKSSSSHASPMKNVEEAVDPFQILNTASENSGLLDQWLTKVPEATVLKEILFESKALLKDDEQHDSCFEGSEGEDAEEEESAFEFQPGHELASTTLFAPESESESDDVDLVANDDRLAKVPLLADSYHTKSTPNSFPSEGIDDQDLLESLVDDPPNSESPAMPSNVMGPVLTVSTEFDDDVDDEDACPFDLETLAIIDAHLHPSPSLEPESRPMSQIYIESLKGSTHCALGYLKFRILSVLTAVMGTKVEMVCSCLSVSLADGQDVAWHIVLEEEWANTPLCAQDTFNITGPWESFVSISTSPSGLAMGLTVSAVSTPSLSFILFPDYLITSTALSDATSCIRRAYLNLKYTTTQLDAELSTSPALVEGTMMHELFQYCLASRDFRLSFIKQTAIPLMMLRHKVSLVSCQQLDEAAARAKLMEHATKLVDWARKYMPDVQLEGPSKTVVTDVIVKDVLDIEDYIVSPQYGLKGKLDATFLIQKTKRGIDRQLVKPYRVPFEFKTGKVGGSASHRAQASLYTLLLASKYGAEAKSPESLLCYLNGNIASNMMTLVPALSHELRGILATRNALVRYLYDAGQEETEAGSSLPPQLDLSSWTCKACFVRDKCVLMATLRPTVSGATLQYDADASASLVNGTDWFRSYDTALSREEGARLCAKADIWNAASFSWIGKLTTKSGTSLVPDAPSFSLCFQSHLSAHPYAFECTLTLVDTQDSHDRLLLKPGDRVSVSYIGPLCPQYFLASGIVDSMSESTIQLKVDRNFCVEDQKTNLFLLTSDHGSEAVYKLDRDVSVSVISYLRSSLLSIFQETRHAGPANKIHALMRACKTGRLFEALQEHQARDPALTREDWQRLTTDERQSLSRDLTVQAGNDRHGMLASLIEMLLAQRKAILIVHPATWTDELATLLTARQMDYWQVGVAREGQPAVTLSSHDLDAAVDMSQASVAQVRAMWQSKSIVAVSHSATVYYTHPLFSIRTWFDCCLWIDFGKSAREESSALRSLVSELALLGPLRMSQQWIFIQ